MSTDQTREQLEQKLEELRSKLTREDWEANGPLRQAYQEVERQIFIHDMMRNLPMGT